MKTYTNLTKYNETFHHGRVFRHWYTEDEIITLQAYNIHNTNEPGIRSKTL